MKSQEQSGPGLLTIIILLAIGWYIGDRMWGGDDSDPNGPVQPDDGGEETTAAEIWVATADMMAAGDPEHTQELMAYVEQLKEDGFIAQGDVDKFRAAFPGIDSEFRPLTAADADKVRSLAR